MANIVVFTGAGISVESGLQTYRAEDGIWNDHNLEDVCTVNGWNRDPEFVLSFYNNCRKTVSKAEPNAAHKAIADLEKYHTVKVLTTNIDDLHERAGSTDVLHLHGSITKARGVNLGARSIDIGYKDITLGDTCEAGYQLRPDIVWFGEEVNDLSFAKSVVFNADKFLVVGAGLTVFPVAGLVTIPFRSDEKVVVDIADNFATLPSDYEIIKMKASEGVPLIVKKWISS